ncbi:hypothetical protein E1573_24965 [Pseudomonas sp. H9]|nr:hypothetical protein E1573_24965 [Pseudomonas sp. H9]
MRFCQSWGGRSKVRRVLYIACWVVIRHNQDFSARYSALLKSGAPWREQLA